MVDKAGLVERTLFTAFLAVLVWAPLPFASNRIWSGALLAVLVFTILLVWMLLFACGRVQIDKNVWRRARLPFVLLVLVQLWVLIQTLNFPPVIIEFLSPQAFQWHVREGWLSISLDRAQTQYYLILGLMITSSFFLALALVNTHARVKTLMQVLVFSGTFQACYGVFMVLSGLEIGFFVEKYTGVGVATGTFVNRNHLAGYLVMCMAAGIGLLLSQLVTDSAQSWREHLRRWLALLLSPKIRLRVYLAIMVIALVLTRSRMGSIAFFVSLGLAGAIALFAGRRLSVRIAVFLASLFFVDVLVLGRWFGFDKLVARLQSTNPDTELRVWSNEYTLDYIAEFPLTGSGGGSFYGVFPNFQASNLQGFHVHAHNDYLEFAAELGVIATGVLVAFVGLAFWSACVVQFQRHTALYKGAGFAVTMTILWAAIHSFVDFNLQIPANAMTFVTILALAYISRGIPGYREG